MIRTSALPRPARAGAAVAGVAAVVALAGCAAGSADAQTADAATPASTPAAASRSASVSASSAPAQSASSYADGTYTASGSYQTPESVEQITVTVTVADDVVTDVEITGTPTKAESKRYQSAFIGGIAEVVVGRDLADISVSRVAGSSLTSSGFNAAIAEIRTEAAA